MTLSSVCLFVIIVPLIIDYFRYQKSNYVTKKYVIDEFLLMKNDSSNAAK